MDILIAYASKYASYNYTLYLLQFVGNSIFLKTVQSITEESEVFQSIKKIDYKVNIFKGRKIKKLRSIVFVSCCYSQDQFYLLLVSILAMALQSCIKY